MVPPDAFVERLNVNGDCPPITVKACAPSGGTVTVAGDSLGPLELPTEIVAVALTFSNVAVIVAVPAEIASRSPVGSTVATAALLLVHIASAVRSCCEPSVYVPVKSSCTDDP